MTPLILCTALAIGQPTMGQAESIGIGVVLTDAGQLHEGKIDQLGDFVRIMSGGRSTVVKRVNVAMMGETKDEAYEYLQRKKKSDSAADAAGLAEWCRKNGLLKTAAEEAKLALRLAPTDRGIAKLAMDCEEDAKRNRPVLRVVGGSSPPSAKSVATQTIPAATIPSMRGDVKPVSSVPVTLEQSFAKFVQPMLINTCVNCHADPARLTTFRLARIPEGIIISPKTTENAMAAMGQVSKVNPLGSPLVQKAITAHGGRSTAPLDRSTTAYKNLETWVTAAAATLPAQTPVTPVTQVASTISPSPASASPTLLPDLIVPPPAPTPAAAPSPTIKPVDPFDPAEFNRVSPKKP